MSKNKSRLPWIALLILSVLAASCLPQQVGPVSTPSLQKSPFLTKSSTQTPEATFAPTLIPTATYIPTTPPLATVTASPTPLPFTGMIPPAARLRISKGGMQFLALSPDGKDVVIASSAVLCSYRVMDGSENWCRTTGDMPGNALRSLAFSPAGKIIATALQNGDIDLWDSTSGVQTLAIQTSLNFMSNLDWSLDGRMLAITTEGAGTPPGTVRIFDSQDGKLLQKLTSEVTSPLVIRWSPDGKFIAGGEFRVTVFEVAMDSEIFSKLPFPDGYPVTGLAWSKDGTTLMAASSFTSCAENCTPTYDGDIAFLDARSGATLRLMNVGDGVDNLALSPDGTLLAAGLHTNEIRLYRTVDGCLEATLPAAGALGAAWFPEGRHLFTTNGADNLVTWDISSGKQSVLPLDGFVPVYSLAWSPDSSRLATVAGGRPVSVWDTATGRLSKKFGIGSGLNIAWSPDGKQVATEKDRLVYICDAQTGDLLKNLAATGKYFWDLEWSKDGRFFAFISACRVPGDEQDCIANIWDAKRWSVLKTFPVNRTDYYLAWSPDGKVLATGAGGMEGISLWDVETGKLIRSFAQNLGSAEGLAWSPDGTKLVTNAGTIWDAATGSVLVQVSGDGQQAFASAALSLDGKLLATGGDYINLYDAQDGKLLQTLNGFANYALQVAFSPDGRTLASRSTDGTVILWSVQPSDTFPLAPTPTSTAVPPGVFPLLLYPPLVLNYDPAVWEDMSIYGNPDRAANTLRARGMATLHVP